MDHDDETPAGEGSTRDDDAEGLTNRYLRRVFNIAFRMLGDREMAGAVAREVFLEVCRDAERTDVEGFRERLYRLTIRESIARLNDGNRAGERDPGEEVERALMRLRPECRAVVILRHCCGCSYREIGEILGVREETAKTRLFAARRQLRDAGTLGTLVGLWKHDRTHGERSSGSGG